MIVRGLFHICLWGLLLQPLLFVKFRYSAIIVQIFIYYNFWHLLINRINGAASSALQWVACFSLELLHWKDYDFVENKDTDKKDDKAHELEPGKVLLVDSVHFHRHEIDPNKKVSQLFNGASGRCWAISCHWCTSCVIKANKRKKKDSVYYLCSWPTKLFQGTNRIFDNVSTAKGCARARNKLKGYQHYSHDYTTPYTLPTNNYEGV